MWPNFLNCFLRKLLEGIVRQMFVCLFFKTADFFRAKTSAVGNAILTIFAGHL